MLSIAHIHPIAVHFPIVFFLSLAGFDTLMLVMRVPISGRHCVPNISAALAVLAGLAAVVTYTFGDMAYDAAIASGVAAAELETHETLGTITAICFAAWALIRGYVWWRGISLDGARKWAIVLIEIAGVLLITTTAYFGGQLVYELGVNVGRAVGG
jgi:uncharacterized membrane protein